MFTKIAHAIKGLTQSTLKQFPSLPWRSWRLGGLALLAIVSLAAVVSAQTESGSVQKAPTVATRPFVVLPNQSLNDVQRKLQPENKTEELTGGEGVQLRVAIQHEKNRADAAAELHDASDDVYYVLEGSATLILGGKLEAPREAQPGEWRSPRIVGGKEFEVKKGDLIIVPRGTAHQRTTAGKDFMMILIKVYAEGMPRTK
jgi:mannose-6-phosphate isomerase-like protein (cupin superfamily)